MISNFIDWNPNPDIFTIPGIDWPVRWYGLLWAVAFILSFVVMNKVYQTEGRTAKQLDMLTIYIIVGTVLGARVGHYLFYEPDLLFSDPWEWFVSMITPPFSGLASHGGALGIIIAMILYCRKTKERQLWLFDRMVIVVPVAGMCIRLGNLINGEIVGSVTNVPWAFLFNNNDVDHINLMHRGIPVPPRHPAQLYEAVFCLILFFVMFWLWKSKRNKVGPGFMFGIFCVLLFTERFIDEFFKVEQVEFEQGMALNMGQILSIPFIIIGCIMMLRSRKLEKYAAREISNQEPIQ